MCPHQDHQHESKALVIPAQARCQLNTAAWTRKRITQALYKIMQIICGCFKTLGFGVVYNMAVDNWYVETYLETIQANCQKIWYNRGNVNTEWIFDIIKELLLEIWGYTFKSSMFSLYKTIVNFLRHDDVLVIQFLKVHVLWVHLGTHTGILMHMISGGCFKVPRTEGADGTEMRSGRPCADHCWSWGMARGGSSYNPSTSVFVWALLWSKQIKLNKTKYSLGVLVF